MSKQTKNQTKVTTQSLTDKKAAEKKIACLTAYDWLFASILDKAGVDLILVGDSASMVFAGHETTLPITLDQMIYHTQCAARGIEHALLIADMPFLSYQTTVETAILNAGRLMKEGGAEGVKLEGGSIMAETIHHLVSIGIPVMGHLGLTPQSVKQFGGYKLQGNNDKAANSIIQDAKILEEAGVFALVLEKIPAELAQKISQTLAIPTIGIGAGSCCDGQILVTHDMLGLFETFKPKFVRRYAQLGKQMRESVERYVQDIQSGRFPSEKESY